MKKTVLVIFILFLLFIGARENSFAFNGDGNRDSLKGITEIAVIIEPVPAVASQLGLTRKSIRTQVERELRKAGITIDQTSNKVMVVKFTVTWMASINIMIFHGQIIFAQPVLLSGDTPELLNNGITWSKGTLGQARMDEFLSYSKTLIQGLLDDFLNAYLSVNPGN